MSFWKTKEGKIMSTLIHDHNNALSWIPSVIERYNNGKSTKKEFDKDLQDMNKYIKKAKDAVDYAYKQFKEEYEKSLTS